MHHGGVILVGKFPGGRLVSTRLKRKVHSRGEESLEMDPRQFSNRGYDGSKHVFLDLVPRAPNAKCTVKILVAHGDPLACFLYLPLQKPQIIQEYESGKAIPNPQILAKLERILGVKLRGKLK